MKSLPFGYERKTFFVDAISILVAFSELRELS